jgi:choice-of-anchor B domain-containing protein
MVRRALLLASLLLALPAVAAAQVTTRNMELKAHFDSYAGYSACWSYIHGDGREYAVLGTTTGTAIYNVTDPVNTTFVGFIAGSPSDWREMKSYRNWIYVGTEASGTAGIQIISMVNPQAPVLVGTYSTGLRRAHTVAVDTSRALLFLNGTTDVNGTARGMHILSLATPTAPTFVGRWPAGAGAVSTTNYIHDSVPIGNRLFASSIYAGIQRVIDITNPANPVEISSWSYNGAFSHNAWPDASGTVLYVTDEVNGEPLKVFDITSVTSPVLANAITSNPQAIVHNAHVLGNELYLSNYTEGIRLLDISDPLHPAEFAWADSWPGVSGGFHGVWEVCPYFPSGTVIASDIETGLYVYRPVRDYGLVRVEVQSEDVAQARDACGVDGPCCCGDIATCACGPGHHLLAGVGDAQVYLTTQGDSITTLADGIAVFAPNPGAHSVTVKKFGYYDQTVNVDVGAGDRDTLRVTLAARPTHGFSGTVRNAVTAAPLLEAEVNLVYTPLHGHTDAAGFFNFPSVPDDVYRVDVRAPGHIPIEHVRSFGPTASSTDYVLQPAPVYDAFEIAGGWTVGAPGDDATTGQWVRVEPLGTGAHVPTTEPIEARPLRERLAATLDSGGLPPLPGLDHEGHESDGAVPGDVQPEFDRTPAPGTMCFVTGQGTAPGSIGEADIDNGKTSLISPAFDLTGMTDPVIGYWHWFYGATDLANDWLAVAVSNDNGGSWVPVDSTFGLHAHWMEKAIHVAAYVTPTAQVRVRFQAADYGVQGIAEAAIDDVTAYDAASSPVAVDPAGAPSRLAFVAPSPNPARGRVRLALDLPGRGPVRVEVVDVTGRQVRVLHDGLAEAGRLSLTWDGADARGRHTAAGLYFARATTPSGAAVTRFARVE